MKAKTKKCGVLAALAAVLLLSAALVTTCVDQLDTSDLTIAQGKVVTDFVPPPGKGYVILNFGEAGSGRTVKPDTTSLDALTKFGCFDVVFTASNSDNDETYHSLTVGQLTGPHALTDDTYGVSVWAYPSGTTTGNATGTAIAFGSVPAATLTVTSSQGTSTPAIVLKEITTGVGNGTFKLAMTAIPNPMDASYVAKLTLEGYTSGTKVVDDVTVTTTLGSGYENTAIPSGFYRVYLDLSQTDKKAVAVREILHIYQGMTSTFAAPLPVLKTNVYIITFNANGNPTAFTPTPSTVGKITHGSAITLPTNTPAVSTPRTFDGWFYDSDATIAFDSTAKPLADTTLYAGYTPPYGGASISVTIRFDNEDGADPQFAFYEADGTTVISSPYTFNRTSPRTIQIKVTNATDFDATWEWTDDGDDLLTTGDTLTIDLSDFDYMLPGPRLITASADHTASGQPRSNTVIITIAP